MGKLCGKCGKFVEDIPSHAYAFLCTECAKTWESKFDGSRGSFYYSLRPTITKEEE